MIELIKLYTGIAASWISLFGLINKVASDETKEDIRIFFLSKDEGKATWSPLFLSFFDQVFGSPILLLRSLAATYLGFLLLGWVSYYLEKTELVFFLHLVSSVSIAAIVSLIGIRVASLKIFSRGFGYNEVKVFALGLLVIPIPFVIALLFFGVQLIFPVDPRLAQTISIFFFVNVVCDFAALNQTRWFLRLHSLRKLSSVKMVSLDLLAKLGIYVMSWVLLLVTSLYATGGDAYQREGLIRILTGIFAVLLDQEVASLNIRMALLISFYTTVIASLWLWIFLLGRYLLFLLQKGKWFLQFSLRYTDKKQTITAIGILTIPFVLLVTASYAYLLGN